MGARVIERKLAWGPVIPSIWTRGPFRRACPSSMKCRARNVGGSALEKRRFVLRSIFPSPMTVGLSALELVEGRFKTHLGHRRLIGGDFYHWETYLDNIWSQELYEAGFQTRRWAYSFAYLYQRPLWHTSAQVSVANIWLWWCWVWGYENLRKWAAEIRLFAGSFRGQPSSFSNSRRQYHLFGIL